MILEDAKKLAEQLTRLARPTKEDLATAALVREPLTHRFRADGIIPNHPRWPLVVYKGAVRFHASLDPAAVLEGLFKQNGWGDSWRNGIYDYVHYHSRIHEVLGVARGKGKVRFGGDHGRTLSLKAGDVAILPAGTGHQALSSSKDFLVVGAYPPSGPTMNAPASTTRNAQRKRFPKCPGPAKTPSTVARAPC